MNQTRLWTRGEYHRAAETGLLGPEERLELLEGEIFCKMSPQSDAHAFCVSLTAEVLRGLFASGYHVREEKPMVLSDRSEPEPDVVVVHGSLRDSMQHPTPATVALVVEVSDTTLAFDRKEKANAYACSGLADYWILNVRGRCLEVRRDPGPMGTDEFGYRFVRIVAAQGEVAPLERPTQAIRVADLLPPEH